MIRVLVIHGSSPFLAGVEHLLSHENDMNTFGIASTDLNEITQEIERLNPDVIIAEEKMPWLGSQKMFSLLTMITKLRVVVVINTENRLEVYEKKEIFIDRLADFISVVRSG